MILRKATIEDIETLIKLRFDYLAADHWTLSENEENTIREQLKTYFTNNIHHNCIAVLAEMDGRVVSTAFLALAEKPANPSFVNGKTGTLLNVFTYPEYRRKGLATKVINMILEEARKMNVSSVDLSATNDGKPLYEKLGFKEPKYPTMKLQLI